MQQSSQKVWYEPINPHQQIAYNLAVFTRLLWPSTGFSDELFYYCRTDEANHCSHIRPCVLFNIYIMPRILGLWCLTSLSTIFQYIVAVSFIGGENRSTRRRPQTWSHNVVSRIPRLNGIRTHYVSNSCLKTIDIFIESALYDVHIAKII